MSFLRNLAGALIFRSGSLRTLASGRSVTSGAICFVLGFLSFVSVRNASHGRMPDSSFVRIPPGLLESFLDLHLLQMLIFLSLVYVPALVALSNVLARDGLGFSVPRAAYTRHVSALLPVWGAIFFAGAPLLPVFLLMGDVDVSAGELWLALAMAAYTIWSVKELNYLGWRTALGVCCLSLLTIPVLLLLTNFLISLPFLILIPLLYVFLQRFQELMAVRSSLRDLRIHLRRLTLNPRDADAHYQLGLIHFRSGHPDAARSYFEQALAIDPEDPYYHYYSGRVLEGKGDWAQALASYESAYRLNPEYGQGDIFREVGKGYLHTGQLPKAIEFLKYFLERRPSDPEGRYWLAVALQKNGAAGEMRAQLSMVLDTARTAPRFFRKQNREWIYRSRELLRGRDA